MGIIARQSFKKGIVYGAGVLVGVFSSIFVYPLAKDGYGLVQFILGSVSLLAAILSFGSTSIITRFYPELKNKLKDNLLTFIYSIVIITIISISILILIFNKLFIGLLNIGGFNIDLLGQNAISIYLLAILLILTQILIVQSANLKRIVVPNIIHEFAFKIYLPILILVYYFGYINIEIIPYFLLLFYTFSLILNAGYLKKLGGLTLGKFKFNSLGHGKLKEIISYMGFSGFNIISENLSVRIDTVMIPLLLNLSGNGVYAIFAFMSNTIYLPLLSIFPIASPIISDSMQNNDLKNVNSVYKKTSTNSLIVGGLIFIIIWVNIHEIVGLMPKNNEIMPFINVFLFLGLAKLVDIITSVNTYIIIYSKFYKYNMFFLIILAISNIIMNYTLINKIGITGAALATLISLILYNTLKLIFIKWKFGITPFSKDTLKVLLLVFFTFVVGYILPETKFGIISIIYKSLIMTGIYYTLIKIFKLKVDVVDIIENLIIKYFRMIY